KAGVAPGGVGRILAGSSQPAQRLHRYIFDLLRRQRAGQRGVVELGVMTRTGHRANVHETFDAIGSQQRDEALNRQCRMTERENSAFRPIRSLRRFAHLASPARTVLLWIGIVEVIVRSLILSGAT